MDIPVAIPVKNSEISKYYLVLHDNNFWVVRIILFYKMNIFVTELMGSNPSVTTSSQKAIFLLKHDLFVFIIIY